MALRLGVDWIVFGWVSCLANQPRRKGFTSVVSNDASSSNAALDAAIGSVVPSAQQSSYRSTMLRPVRRRRVGSFNVPSSSIGLDDDDSMLQDLESPNYVDLGGCTYVCEFCGATFWFDERLKSARVSSRPRYGGCCKYGKVVIDYPKTPPDLLRLLFSDSNFMVAVRAYNYMFSMTSFGAIVDDAINQGSGPYVFKVAGQISHWVGSLCPRDGDFPRFLQLYICDTENEIHNRMRFFPTSESAQLREDIVQAISCMLDAINGYVQLFRSARELCLQPSVPQFYIKLYSRSNNRRYNPPAAGTLGAIISGGTLNSQEFDVIIRSKDDRPHRISRLHPSYMPLQYPLLFPAGEQGWSPELRLLLPDDDGDRKLTPAMFYSYQLHERENVHTHLLKAGRLFQQYVVDAYVCVEQCRLEYIRSNQNTFRTEFLCGIHDAISRGDTEGRNIGKRVVLPSSFTGGPRYMYKHYQDALALCRVYGNPQYFITFTCNAQWPEIRRELRRAAYSGANDRPDVVVRVFQLKVLAFINFLKTEKPFGDVTAELYTIEFQKRGLPHCHTLLWVADPYVVRTSADVDRYICAELPDRVSNPVLYRIVTTCMLHGPCGSAMPTATCMKDNKCSKDFPKAYEQATFFDDSGHVHYRRNSNGDGFLKNGVTLDNGYVVPYNVALLLRFDAHINVEYCGWSMLIKYLFKYISKGADRIRYALVRDDGTVRDRSSESTVIVDEINNFIDGRYICPHEAVWRIFGYPIQHRRPAVQLLAVHLNGMQNVTFRDNQQLIEIAENDRAAKTTLTEWLVNNTQESAPDFNEPHNGLHLRYVDYLTEYRWDQSNKKWLRRKSRRLPSVGRLSYVHPSCGELFYLRLLLTHQSGCCSFEDIRTVSSTIMSTYREACEKLGLVGHDHEWHETIKEAATWASSNELRLLFVHLLLFCDISDPPTFWNENWRCMSEDVAYALRKTAGSNSTLLTDYNLQQRVLYELEHLLSSGSTTRSLSEFGLPLPDEATVRLMANRLIQEEQDFDRESLELEHDGLHHLLNGDQRAVYNAVMLANTNSTQTLLFVYGYGGTGKTFLWRTIITRLRSMGQIVLAVAASGIASLLLPSGRTAHSRFKIPIDLTEESVCYIKKNTHK